MLQKIPVYIRIEHYLYVLYERRESSNCHESYKRGCIHYYFTSTLKHLSKYINTTVHNTDYMFPQVKPYISNEYLLPTHLDRTVAVTNLVEDGAEANANAQINAQTHPVVAYVPVHIQEGSSCQHKELCQEAGLLFPSKWSSTLLTHNTKANIYL